MAAGDQIQALCKSKVSQLPWHLFDFLRQDLSLRYKVASCLRLLRSENRNELLYLAVLSSFWVTAILLPMVTPPSESFSFSTLQQLFVWKQPNGMSCIFPHHPWHRRTFHVFVHLCIFCEMFKSFSYWIIFTHFFLLTYLGYLYTLGVNPCVDECCAQTFLPGGDQSWADSPFPVELTVHMLAPSQESSCNSKAHRWSIWMTQLQKPFLQQIYTKDSPQTSLQLDWA